MQRIIQKRILKVIVEPEKTEQNKADRQMY